MDFVNISLLFQIDSFVLDEQEEETGELSEDEDEEDDSRLGKFWIRQI